jgi:hypothetical protein
VELDGVTVITRNEKGLIARLAIHHRPMQGAILFSTRLGESLRGEIEASHFLPSTGAVAAHVQNSKENTI